MRGLKYRQTKDHTQRVVILLPTSEVDHIDRWGVPAGMPNRTKAIRELIALGLEVARKAQNAGMKKGEAA